MNSVYEGLRSLLRNKEMEIKKLEKEIEALRIVLPIVADAGDMPGEAGPTFDSPRPMADVSKPKSTLPAPPDFDQVMAQAKSAQGTGNANGPRPATQGAGPESVSKSRTSWP
jgi:hypothetical protein